MLTLFEYQHCFLVVTITITNTKQNVFYFVLTKYITTSKQILLGRLACCCCCCGCYYYYEYTTKSIVITSIIIIIIITYIYINIYIVIIISIIIIIISSSMKTKVACWGAGALPACAPWAGEAWEVNITFCCFYICCFISFYCSCYFFCSREVNINKRKYTIIRQ